MTAPLAPFDGNGYRKRVLAVVARRGGPDSSDPFELYDLAVEDAERVPDAAVAARIDEVWAFWQRQRDHPKYGSLVGLLVASHDERSAPLYDRQQRASLAVRVRAERARREAGRYELLDQAIRRLVDRHRGIPRDKIDGLVELGALGGLSAEQVHARLRHHHVVDAAPAAAVPAPAATAVSDHRRQQVRDLLDEFGRLHESPPPPTLLALLGLDPEATPGEISLRAEAWRARARELPPTRVRAVADELLVHVRELLEAGPEMLARYLDVVVHDVAERLRPRVRAAVLVEDRLVADDHEHLVTEATELGLDWARARRVVADIAAELGVEAEPFGAAPPPARRPAPSPARRWEEPLRAARAALRAGRLVEARGHAARALALAGGDPAGAAPVRAVADEIEAAIGEAELRWRAAATAIGARRFAEAVEHLEQLCRTAADVPSPSGTGSAELELDRARREVAAADDLVAAAATSPDPAGALLAVLERWPGHPAAAAALAAVPLRPPGGVRATRDRSGAVVVTWQPSATAGVSYRVTRLLPDGTTRVVGRTSACLVEDGGAATSGPLPDYAVVAVRAGESSAEARTGMARPRPRPTASADLAAPAAVRAVRARDGSVLVSWRGPAGAQYKVSRRTPDGRWQVVGRTSATSLEDGGAPGSGAPPVYAVVAARDGVYSAEVLSG